MIAHVQCLSDLFAVSLPLTAAVADAFATIRIVSHFAGCFCFEQIFFDCRFSSFNLVFPSTAFFLLVFLFYGIVSPFLLINQIFVSIVGVDFLPLFAFHLSTDHPRWWCKFRFHTFLYLFDFLSSFKHPFVCLCRFSRIQKWTTNSLPCWSATDQVCRHN